MSLAGLKIIAVLGTDLKVLAFFGKRRRLATLG